MIARASAAGGAKESAIPSVSIVRPCARSRAWTNGMSNHKPLPLATSLGAVLGLTWLYTRVARAAGPKLVVFAHVAIKQRAFQTLLQEALPGLSVTTVGRVADFDRALSDAPDAVLALPLVLKAHGLSPKLRGQREGSSDEKYCLVGADVAPNPGSVRTVGAVDLVGREGMNAFVHGLLGGEPKVERVTKVEDLLPLLQMQRADAVLLPLRLFSDLKSTSSLNLAQRELANKVGIVAVAGVGEGGAQAVAEVGKLSGDAAKALGVESWK
jgi:hypothetical protein